MTEFITKGDIFLCACVQSHVHPREDTFQTQWDISDQNIITYTFLHPSIHPSSFHSSISLFIPLISLPSTYPFVYSFLLAWPRFRVYGWQPGGRDTWFIDWKGLATHSFLSHHLLSGLGHSQDPGACAHTEEYKQHSVWELQRGLFTRVTQMFLLAPQQVVVGRLRGLFWGLGVRRGPNRAPEPGWELPLWDTKHCLCWERPWGWEHRPELDTEQWI